MGISLWLPWCLSLLLVCNMTKNGSGVSTSDTIMCIQSERQALLEFKHGLFNDSGHLFSWGSEQEKKDCCNWLGVSCNNQTHNVVELNLVAMSLHGPISTSLVGLHGLTVLDLSNNNLVGEIPNQFGNLHALRALYLYSNHLADEIPNQLGNLHALRYLDLSNNNLFGGIPYQLGNLHALRYLDLSYNNLSGGIPYQLGNLHALTDLDLSYSNLSGGIPTQLGNLHALRYLDLSYNNLSGGIPYQLGNLHALTDLDLSYNNLSGGIPNQLGNLHALMVLDLSSNHLTAEIPNQLGNLHAIRTLDLSLNDLTGEIPNQLGNFSALQILGLGYNRALSSAKLEWLSSLSQLLYIELNDINLTTAFDWPQIVNTLRSLIVLNLHNCSLPNVLFPPTPSHFNSFFQLPNISTLVHLDLSQNFLQGTFSEGHMSNLSSLQFLSLSHNNLLIISISSNWIPPFQLHTLDLSHCKVGPDFPSWLRRHNHLTGLDISNVGIRNSVPGWFWEELTPQLGYLNMSGNQMWGTISSSAFQSLSFPKFTFTLDLSSNHFEGQIPAFHTNSTYIDLSNNQFSGPPHALCLTELLMLEMLDLSNNLLSGEIHGCKTSFPNLAMLNLANNSFSGKFPNLTGSSCQLASLHLENNNFTGVLPWQLQNCKKLQVMDLRINNFSGKMPMWIGQNLLNLVILSLQANNFNGSIPIHLCNLTKLQILDLCSNNFSGPIPICFGNFTAMAHSGSSDLTISINTDITTIESGGHYYAVHPKNDYAALGLKGEEFLYRNTLGLVKGMDLSSNKLSGRIPKEITLLVGLISLNLSTNNLIGRIPSQMGRMQQLESLDLSRNKLHGPIPTSLSRLNFLSCLDLGNNNLSGRIPRSAHLDTINASAYEGNKGLCGPPLTSDCLGDGVAESPSDARVNGDADAQEEKNEIIGLGFFVCMGFGFILGFWGVFGTLLVKDSWRNACAMFLISMKNEIHVAVVVSMARLKK